MFTHTGRLLILRTAWVLRDRPGTVGHKSACSLRFESLYLGLCSCMLSNILSITQTLSPPIFYNMEIELTNTHTSPGYSPDPSGQRRYAKDEAVLARFGKKQQLRVSALPNIITPSRLSFSCSSFADFWGTERVWTALCHRSY